MEGLRGDSLWLIQPDTVSWLSGGIRVSQLLSVVLVIAVLVFALVRWRREKKLGRLIWPEPEAVLDGAEEAGVPAPEPEGAEAADAPEETEPAGAVDAPAEQEQDETQDENKEGTEE